MKSKNLLLFLLALILIYTNAKANESEPNNTKAQASTLALNGSNNGTITSGDVDWWAVTTTADGKLTVTLSALSGADFYGQLYDNNGVTQLGGNIESYSNTPAVLNVDGLAPGTYYIKVFPYSTSTGSYTLSNSLTVPTQGNDVEPNNYAKQALTLPLNGSKGGHLDYYYNQVRDGVDWYKVTTNADGRLRVTLSALNGADFYAQLFDKDTVTQLGGNIESYSNTPAVLNVDGLAPGTYYIKLFPYSTSFGTYTLADSLFVPAQANDAEPNNYAKQALTLPLNGSTGGHLDYYYNHVYENTDWYKVTTNVDGRLRITLSALNGADFYAQLYDKDTISQLGGNIESYSNTPAVLSVDGLAPGTYYIKLSPYSTSVGTYTLADSLFPAAQANDAEPNNYAKQAVTLPLNSKKSGHLDYYYDHVRDVADWYKLTTDADGYLRITLSALNGADFYAQLYDKDTVTQLGGTIESYANNPAILKVDGLAAGTYYVKLTPYSTSFGTYTLADSLFEYNANDIEPNKFAIQAKTLFANAAGKGHIDFHGNNNNDVVDWSKINYTGTGNLSITFTLAPHLSDGALGDVYFYVYKDTAGAPLSQTELYGSTSTATVNFNSLQQGYYYVKVFPYGTSFSAYTITPTFTQVNIATVRVSSYDTTGGCDSANSIVFKLDSSHSPYRVQLYRFGDLYKTYQTVNKTLAVSSLPTGAYFAKVYGDGADGNAFDKSKNVFIEPVVTGLSVNNIQTTKVKLNWDTLDCPAYYVIQYKKHGVVGWAAKQTNGNVNAFTLANLSSGTYYDWRVASADSANNITAQSEYSVTSHFTTAAGFAANSIGVGEDMNIAQGKIAGILNVSPNPASSYFTIRHNINVTDKVNATLFNMNGKAVWSSGLVNTNALNGKQIMVSSFASGLYYLKVTDSKGTAIANIKVVIVK